MDPGEAVLWLLSVLLPWPTRLPRPGRRARAAYRDAWRRSAKQDDFDAGDLRRALVDHSVPRA